MPGPYDIGDRVTVASNFTTGGTAFNPSTVVFTYQAPSGTQATAALSNPQTGTFTSTVDPDEIGIYQYRFVGTGGTPVSEYGEFTVRMRRLV